VIVRDGGLLPASRQSAFSIALAPAPKGSGHRIGTRQPASAFGRGEPRRCNRWRRGHFKQAGPHLDGRFAALAIESPDRHVGVEAPDRGADFVLRRGHEKKVDDDGGAFTRDDTETDDIDSVGRESHADRGKRPRTVGHLDTDRTIRRHRCTSGSSVPAACFGPDSATSRPRESRLY
jgi:hypothetical protein